MVMSILTPTPLGEARLTTRETRSAPAAEDVFELELPSTLIGRPDVRGGIVVRGMSPFELTLDEDTCPGTVHLLH